MINKGAGTHLFLVVIAAVVVGAVLWYLNKSDNQDIVKITAPGNFSSETATGKRLFENNCSTCHGKNAGGSDRGPSLIHKIYKPSHHSDASFYLAAKKGVRRHHWSYGNMPPVSDITDNDIAAIVSYVCFLQRAHGIFELTNQYL